MSGVIRVIMLVELRPMLEQFLKSRGLILAHVDDTDPDDWIVVPEPFAGHAFDMAREVDT